MPDGLPGGMPGGVENSSANGVGLAAADPCQRHFADQGGDAAAEAECVSNPGQAAMQAGWSGGSATASRHAIVAAFSSNGRKETSLRAKVRLGFLFVS